jgi:hypothetical protein
MPERQSTADISSDMEYLANLCGLAYYIMDAFANAEDGTMWEWRNQHIGRFHELLGPMQHSYSCYEMSRSVHQILETYGQTQVQRTTALLEFKQKLNAIVAAGVDTHGF